MLDSVGLSTVKSRNSVLVGFAYQVQNAKIAVEQQAVSPVFLDERESLSMRTGDLANLHGEYLSGFAVHSEGLVIALKRS